MTLIELLKNSSEKYRSLPALIMRPRWRTMVWDYEGLSNFAENLSELLKKEGLRKGEAVLLWSENSPWWVGVFFGILKARGRVIPLHTENTPEFIERIRRQTGARILLKSSHLKINLSRLKTFNIDLLEFATSPKPSWPDPDENEIAEIIYTSGTTGEPKGVMLSHKNIISNLEALSLAIPLSPSDRLLSILPLGHMFEQTVGMLFPLRQGARIVYLPRIASGLITRALLEHRITKLVAVPQFLDTVMKRIEARAQEEVKEKIFKTLRRLADYLPFWARHLLFYKIHRRFGGKLKTVASGGAPLDPHLEKKWELLGVKLLQGYGLTETSPVLTANTYRAHRFGSVGKALTEVEIKIEPDSEILAKGPNIFPGYFKNDTQTKEAFTPEGWFKTGDIGKFDRDGFLYLRGRKKYMILGPAGQNVYPEDIEVLLLKEAGVRDAAVVGLEKEGRVEIHAVLLVEKGEDPEAIIARTNERLASFQRIGAWSIWPEEDFPRSATRKVQKEKVLHWLRARKEKPKEAEIATRVGPLLKLLSEIFEKKPGEIHSDSRLVRDLGMDSILRVEVVSRIEEVFGIVLEERLLNDKTTLDDLEKLVQEAKPRPQLRVLSRFLFFLPIRILREIFFWLLFTPLLKIFVRPRIFGREVFENTPGPFLIMPNHRSYLDSPAILWALPPKIRRQMAFAAARDVLREFWFLAPLFQLFAATFSFPRREEEAIEPGLEAVGKVLDRGWSVIVYPEGQMSPTKEVLPLKRGAGFLGVEMEVPIIPVFIDGTEEILPSAKFIPRRRGEVRTYFGKPLYFRKTDSYIEATEKIKEALKELAKNA